MAKKQQTIKQTFLLDQPLFRPTAKRREERWQAVVHDAEPRDKHRKEGFIEAFHHFQGESAEDDKRPFRRLNRDKLVAKLSCLTGSLGSWHRVALICGAGLGKTTNLQWLAAALNHHGNFHGKQLAFFFELKDLTDSAGELLQTILKEINNKKSGLDQKKLQLDLIRRRNQGRITLLLDSLDQAGSEPEDKAVRALNALLESVWSLCPIWVSGRPHAFKQNRELFLEKHHWRYLRIGQLDEAEGRFLLESTREEIRKRKAQ